jgi:multidrug resistance efflux pump
MVESAHAAEGATPETKPTHTEKPLTVPRVMLLQALGLLAVVVLGAVIFYIWHQGYYYYSTNDAMVSGTMATAAPRGQRHRRHDYPSGG